MTSRLLMQHESSPRVYVHITAWIRVIFDLRALWSTYESQHVYIHESMHGRSLSSNKITMLKQDNFRFVNRLPNLEQLLLAGNQLTSLIGGVFTLGLGNNTNLQHMWVLYTHMHTCTYTCIHPYTRLHTHACIYIHMCTRTYTLTCIPHVKHMQPFQPKS